MHREDTQGLRQTGARARCTTCLSNAELWVRSPECISRALHNSGPSQTCASTSRGERMRLGRPACQADRAITQTAA